MMRLKRLPRHLSLHGGVSIEDQAVLDQIVLDAKAAGLSELQQGADQLIGLGAFVLADTDHRHERRAAMAGSGNAAAQPFPEAGQRFAADSSGHGIVGGIVGSQNRAVSYQATLQCRCIWPITSVT